MRRLLSILILLGLTLGPAFEAIPAQALASMPGQRSGWTGKIDESKLPLCCRRNGKHHCTMGAAQDGETILTSNECCPCNPRTVAATTPSSGFAIAEQAFQLSLPDDASALRAIELSGKLSTLDRLHSQRGPPASLLN